MKGSALFCLVFISICLPLTHAHASSPKTIRKDKEGALVLRGAVYTADTVQPGGSATAEQSAPKETLVPEIDETVLRGLKELMASEKYEEMDKLVDGLGKDKFVKHLCQAVTTLDQFKGLFGYLEKRDMVPTFLARGNMELARKVIVETDLLETDVFGECDSIYDAITLSLKEGDYDRVMGLFEAASERPEWKSYFRRFVYGFFIRYPPWKDSMPLKRFLTLHGEVFTENHPDVFKTVYRGLVCELMRDDSDQNSQKLLTDLVGQPYLLTPAVFANGFLIVARRTDLLNFIKYGWREALEEGLKGEYRRGGKTLWTVMKSEYSTQFPGEYPSTDEARTAALKNFPNKQDREEAWAKENAPILLAELERLVPHLLPTVLWSIISIYAITWVVIE